MQLKATAAGAAVDIEARVHNSADWLVIDTLTAGYPIKRIVKMPFLRLVARGNSAGMALVVWDNE